MKILRYIPIIILTVFLLTALEATTVSASVMNQVTDRQIAIILIPSSASVTVGSLFSVDIQVKTADQPVSAIDTFINFDPATFEVTSVSPCTAKLSTQLNNRVDNHQGYIDYSAGTILRPASGTFTIATVNLRLLKETAGSVIYFNTLSPRLTIAAYKDGPIPCAFTSCTIISIAKSEPVPQKNALMKLVASTTTVTAGSAFSVNVEVEAPGQRIAATDVFINFDPAILSVTDLIPAASQLQNQFDPVKFIATGHINFSTGGSLKVATAPIAVATISFKCLKESPGTRIFFNGETPRQTEVAYYGYSILLQTQDCTVTVVAETASLTAAPDTYHGLTLTRVTSVPTSLISDANGDGRVNALDITYLERIQAGLNKRPFWYHMN